MYEKGALPDDPSLPIGRKRESRNQIMNVRVVAQVARPGLQHAEHANLPTQKAWILGELLQSSGGGAKQQRVDRAWVLAGKRAQTSGQREGDQKVWHWQQYVLLVGQPGLAGILLTGRAVAIAAGMVAIAC